MGFSEGVLNEPINPDYQPPFSVIHFEVEFCQEGGSWTSTAVEFGEKQTDDPTQAMRVRDTIVEQGMKARIIRVETIRSQMP